MINKLTLVMKYNSLSDIIKDMPTLFRIVMEEVKEKGVELGIWSGIIGWKLVRGMGVVNGKIAVLYYDVIKEEMGLEYMDYNEYVEKLEPFGE